MKRVLVFFLPIVLIILAGFALFQVLKSNKPETETSNALPQALAVFGEAVERRDFKLEISAQGEVRPRSEINVTPQVGGRISYISDSFVDGGYIPKGQVIARIDVADYELAVVRAKSGVASAQQRLVREQAEAELAIRDIEELGLANSSPLARREPQLAEAQAALDSAYAQLSEANLALERTAIRSPFNGRVREKTVDIGQFVTPGQSFGRIFSTESVEVSLPLTDAQMGRLGLPLAFIETDDAPGPEVQFTATVGGNLRTWTGRITRTSAALNTQSRLINVFGEVVDPYGAGASDGAPMAPGLFVTATIGGETLENVIWAPRAALRGNNDLYLASEDKKQLSIRPVNVLYSDESGAYISDDIPLGTLAIVSPIPAATDGMRLRIRERLPDGTILKGEDDQPTPVAEDASGAEGGRRGRGRRRGGRRGARQ
ncbi:MAG: efflux RND transporter periplasmic adaptor subunit [Hyphomonadaceae bacterium]